MKIRTARASGNPVDPEVAEKFMQERRDGYDKLFDEHGKHGPAISKALDEFDKELEVKYNDLTVIKMELPKSRKAWKEIIDKYGAIVVTGNAQDEREILFMVHDMIL